MQIDYSKTDNPLYILSLLIVSPFIAFYWSMIMFGQYALALFHLNKPTPSSTTTQPKNNAFQS